MSYKNGWDFGFGWSLKPRWCSQLTEMVWFHISSGTLVLNIKTLAFSTNFLTAIMSLKQRNHAVQCFGNFFHGHLALLFLETERPGRRFSQPRNFPNFRRILRKPYSHPINPGCLSPGLNVHGLDLFRASRLLLQKNSLQNKSIWKSQEILRPEACGMRFARNQKRLVFFSEIRGDSHHEKVSLIHWSSWLYHTVSNIQSLHEVYTWIFQICRISALLGRCFFQ